jgi:hypothetical protein
MRLRIKHLSSGAALRTITECNWSGASSVAMRRPQNKDRSAQTTALRAKSDLSVVTTKILSHMPLGIQCIQDDADSHEPPRARRRSGVDPLDLTIDNVSLFLDCGMGSQVPRGAQT